MQKLNAAFRSVDEPTDVLSFPQTRENLEVGSKKYNRNKKMFPTSHFLLGDVVINVQMAESQAKTYGTDFYHEIYLLMIHGILHLLGYEHEGSRSKAMVMRRKEKEILNAVKKIV
jgi:rRNA maturation RNase YbeY